MDVVRSDWGGRAVPANASVFRFSAGLAWLMLTCSLLFFGLVAAAVVVQVADPDRISFPLVVICFFLFGTFSLLSIRSFSRFRDSVAVHAEGIWYLRRRGEATFLAWPEVAKIQANDTQQRLVLSDASGGRRIRLEYQLENFRKLREFVLSRASAPARAHAADTKVFRQAWINKGILLGLAGGFLVAGEMTHQRKTASALYTAAIGVLMLGGITRDPTSLRITDDAVVIHYVGWKQTIEFQTITSISLEDIEGRGNVWTAVTIKREQGEPIQLFRFREGPIVLNDALQAAWKSAVRLDV
jgi:hypothetical protein